MACRFPWGEDTIAGAIMTGMAKAATDIVVAMMIAITTIAMPIGAMPIGMMIATTATITTALHAITASGTTGAIIKYCM